MTDPTASGTARERLARELEAGFRTVKELSGACHLSEREVAAHLPHVTKSAAARGQRLDTLAPRCISCEFLFEGRGRGGRPSRCPRCRSERIARAAYRLVAV